MRAGWKGSECWKDTFRHAYFLAQYMSAPSVRTSLSQVIFPRESWSRDQLLIFSWSKPLWSTLRYFFLVARGEARVFDFARLWQELQPQSGMLAQHRTAACPDGQNFTKESSLNSRWRLQMHTLWIQSEHYERPWTPVLLWPGIYWGGRRKRWKCFHTAEWHPNPGEWVGRHPTALWTRGRSRGGVSPTRRLSAELGLRCTSGEERRGKTKCRWNQGGLGMRVPAPPHSQAPNTRARTTLQALTPGLRGPSTCQVHN